MNVFSDCDLTVGLNAYAKWYDSDEDMCLLSSKFPNLLFELAGIGEDSKDLWKAYFVNGAKQNAPGKVIYDEFDPKKLAPPNNPRTSYSYQ